MGYYGEQIDSVIREIINDELPDFDDTISTALNDVDWAERVSDQLYGTEISDWFDHTDKFVTKDNLDEYALTPDALDDEIDRRLAAERNRHAAIEERVERIERLFAHMHGALEHLAHIAAQVNTHTTDPEA